MRNPALLMSIVFVLSYLGSPTNAAGNDVSSAADNLLAALTAEQRMQAIVPFGGDARTDWHYVPKEERKGLPIKEMTAEQVYLVHILLNESLGQAGYSKTVGIMYLESILRGMEMERGRDGAYEFSFEGHHISLNFTVVDGELIASSPAFFGANPHRVPSGPAKELRILGSEEDRARRLMVSLSEEQARSALIGVDVPGDIFSTASPRVSPDEPQGIKASNLSPDQLELLHQLIDSYVENVADDAALERRAQVSTAGGNIYFAWIGSVESGEAHYYRVQAPSFLIEYDNIQNSANHSHTVWRDYNGDFGRDIIGEHRLAHVH
jgi:hypothetical protein